MLIILVRIRAMPGEEARFLARVRRQAHDSLAAEAGCRQFTVCTDAADPARVLLYEAYVDETAFAAHLASPHFAAFAGETGNWIAEKIVERWTTDDDG